MQSRPDAEHDDNLFGELTPKGGGDIIPLVKNRLLVGRRESCDIVLRFTNISAHHCQMFVDRGYWFIKDLDSRNGTKVNGRRVSRKRVDPGDTIGFAKQQYVLNYSPDALGAMGPPPADEDAVTSILGRSLLDRAGLHRKSDEEAEDFELE